MLPGDLAREVRRLLLCDFSQMVWVVVIVVCVLVLDADTFTVDAAEETTFGRLPVW